MRPDLLALGGCPGFPHFRPRAKRIISLFLADGPLHVDLFDPKPRLNALNGSSIPPELLNNHQQFVRIRGAPSWKGSPYCFRLQASMPALADLGDEPEHSLKLYGADPTQPSFPHNCLLARRLVERGVRFVQLYDRGVSLGGNY